MATLMLNQVYDEFGGDALNRIAAAIGESPAKIRAALSGVVPALMGGIAEKAQTPTGANELMNVIQRDHLDAPRYDHVSDAIQEPGAIGNLMDTGGPLLDTVLPNKTNEVSNWVATNSGISATSSRSLMALTLPLLLGMLGRRNVDGGATGLTGLLGRPLGFLSEVPAGLGSVLGLGAVGGAAAEPVTTGYRAENTGYRNDATTYANDTAGYRTDTATYRKDTNSLSWLWAFIAGLILASIIAWILWPRTAAGLYLSPNLGGAAAGTAPAAPYGTDPNGTAPNAVNPNGTPATPPVSSGGQ